MITVAVVWWLSGCSTQVTSAVVIPRLASGLLNVTVVVSRVASHFSHVIADLSRVASNVSRVTAVVSRVALLSSQVVVRVATDWTHVFSEVTTAALVTEYLLPVGTACLFLRDDRVRLTDLALLPLHVLIRLRLCDIPSSSEVNPVSRVRNIESKSYISNTIEKFGACKSSDS